MTTVIAYATTDADDFGRVSGITLMGIDFDDGPLGSESVINVLAGSIRATAAGLDREAADKLLAALGYQRTSPWAPGPQGAPGQYGAAVE